MDHLELDEGTKFHKKHRKTQSLDFVYSFLYPISKPLDWFRAQREKSTRETLIILIFTVIGKPSKTHYFLLSLPGFFHMDPMCAELSSRKCVSFRHVPRADLVVI